MASATSSQTCLGSAPSRSCEVMWAKRCICWLASCSRRRANSSDSDLSSSMVRIIPKATKNLGTFHSSGFIQEAGGRGYHARGPAPVTAGEANGGKREARGEQHQHGIVISMAKGLGHGPRTQCEQGSQPDPVGTRNLGTGAHHQRSAAEEADAQANHVEPGPIHRERSSQHVRESWGANHDVVEKQTTAIFDQGRDGGCGKHHGGQKQTAKVNRPK